MALGLMTHDIAKRLQRHLAPGFITKPPHEEVAHPNGEERNLSDRPISLAIMVLFEEEAIGLLCIINMHIKSIRVSERSH